MPPEQQHDCDCDDEVDDDVDEVRQIIQADEDLVAEAVAADLPADGFAINSDALLSAVL